MNSAELNICSIRKNKKGVIKYDSPGCKLQVFKSD